MGLDKIFEKATEPKETNRQIGPLFRRWVNKGSLGIKPVSLKEFMSSNDNAILDAGDKKTMNFAKEHLKYKHKKRIRFSRKI